MTAPAERAAALAYAAGLRDRDALTTAVAIAGGESGWNPDAEGDTTITDATWGPSIGIWQVRSLWGQQGTGATRDPDRLHDPAFNAASMVEISSGGTNWQPWSVYTSGAWRSYLPEARAAVDSVLGAVDTGGTAALASFTGGITDIAGKVIDGAIGAIPGGPAVESAASVGRDAIGLLSKLANPKLWRRIGVGALGVLVAVAGVSMLTANFQAKIAEFAGGSGSDTPGSTSGSAPAGADVPAAAPAGLPSGGAP